MSDSFIYTPVLILTPSQKKVEDCTSRFRFIKAGRRFGKTKYAASQLIKWAIENPGESIWYCAPSYRMAKEISFKIIIDQLPREMILKVNERELRIELINGAAICLKGSEEEDSLRGSRIAGLVMDEAAYQKPHVFAEVLRPMLADLRAPALFISSPKPGWFNTAWEYAKKQNDPDYAAFHFTIYDNPYISRKEIEQIKATTTDTVFRQEYMAEDVEFVGQVYNEFRGTSIFKMGEKFDGHEKYAGVVGMDWGLHDPTGVAWLHFTPEGYAVMSKEHVKDGWDTARHAEIIKQGCIGRNLNVQNFVLDRSAFRREGTSGESIADQMREHMGHAFQRSEKDLNSGLDLVKRFLRGDGTTPWLYIAASCKETIRAFQEWEYNDHEPDILAALRYGLVHAVNRRLTALADKVPVMNYLAADLPQVPKGYNLETRRSVRKSWSWDDAAGVPL